MYLEIMKNNQKLFFVNQNGKNHTKKHKKPKDK